MKSTNPSSIDIATTNPTRNSSEQTAPLPDAGKGEIKLPTSPEIRTTGRDYANPVDYQHPYESMYRFANFLALRYDAIRTCHA